MPKPKKPISLPRFMYSTRNAVRGIRIIWIGENSFRIQVALAAAVVVLGFWLGLSAIEWLLVMLTIGLVLGLEATNTVIERAADFLEPRLAHKVSVVKDMMSGAVLIAAIAALIIGLIIFYPKLAAVFGG